MSSLQPPRLVRSRLDRELARWLLPGSTRAQDFAEPAGEAALVPADSVSWRVFKNPVTLFIGGVAAVLMELSEPGVRAGVWQHTTFRTAPMERLQRTGYAAMVTVYGARSRAEDLIARVVRLHSRVRGLTEQGLPYEANDPRLLCWVQATAAFGFLEAHARHVAPLPREARDRYFEEGRAAARLYGARGAPSSAAELESLFEAFAPACGPSPVIVEFLGMMGSVAVLPAPLRGLQRVAVRAAVDLLPAGWRERLALQAFEPLSGSQRKALGAVARIADRLVLPSHPAVQACRRLGLPDGWLFERRGDCS